jgi:hypothetical protein
MLPFIDAWILFAKTFILMRIYLHLLELSLIIITFTNTHKAEFMTIQSVVMQPRKSNLGISNRKLNTRGYMSQEVKMGWQAPHRLAIVSNYCHH